ncbi:hypothetical protein EVAR_16893_1 [Eumeta japonica]|uniref:Uncharacterized protein n=1 Tax=Eumeta variegata TaxID=151549 RepID=A0A4C1TV85_EUMVA|nr:hypothetical protein EVAR_16893_1 [Eumeta japonica]
MAARRGARPRFFHRHCARPCSLILYLYRSRPNAPDLTVLICTSLSTNMQLRRNLLLAPGLTLAVAKVRNNYWMPTVGAVCLCTFYCHRPLTASRGKSFYFHRFATVRLASGRGQIIAHTRETGRRLNSVIYDGARAHRRGGGMRPGTRTSIRRGPKQTAPSARSYVEFECCLNDQIRGPGSAGEGLGGGTEGNGFGTSFSAGELTPGDRLLPVLAKGFAFYPWFEGIIFKTPGAPGHSCSNRLQIVRVLVIKATHGGALHSLIHRLRQALHSLIHRLHVRHCTASYTDYTSGTAQPHTQTTRQALHSLIHRLHVRHCTASYTDYTSGTAQPHTQTTRQALHSPIHRLHVRHCSPYSDYVGHWPHTQTTRQGTAQAHTQTTSGTAQPIHRLRPGTAYPYQTTRQTAQAAYTDYVGHCTAHTLRSGCTACTQTTRRALHWPHTQTTSGAASYTDYTSGAAQPHAETASGTAQPHAQTTRQTAQPHTDYVGTAQPHAQTTSGTALIPDYVRHCTAHTQTTSGTAAYLETTSGTAQLIHRLRQALHTSSYHQALHTSGRLHSLIQRLHVRHCTASYRDYTSGTAQPHTETTRQALHSLIQRLHVRHCTASYRDYTSGTAQPHTETTRQALHSLIQRLHVRHCTASYRDYTSGTAQPHTEITRQALHSLIHRLHVRHCTASYTGYT